MRSDWPESGCQYLNNVIYVGTYEQTFQFKISCNIGFKLANALNKLTGGYVSKYRQVGTYLPIYIPLLATFSHLTAQHLTLITFQSTVPLIFSNSSRVVGLFMHFSLVMYLGVRQVPVTTYILHLTGTVHTKVPVRYCTT